MRVRKKPIEVNAIEFAPPWKGVREFCPSLRFIKDGKRIAFGVIETLEGHMRAEIGDFIIRGVQGEFYPCKPAIFWETYEVVD
jgi:hypothetical protein